MQGHLSADAADISFAYIQHFHVDCVDVSYLELLKGYWRAVLMIQKMYGHLVDFVRGN